LTRPQERKDLGQFEFIFIIGELCHGAVDPN
jgi:hypothetical protein